MRLNAIQEQAAKALREHGTIFGPIGVGHGKTIVGHLAATLIPSARPIYLCPGGLVGATRAKLENYAMEMPMLRPANEISVVSYGILSTRKGAGMLEASRSDLLILDEAHNLKNPQAARTKRVRRHIARSGCAVVAFSGSMMKRSVKDFAHLMAWCLKEESPLPRDGWTIARWARVLDTKPYPPPTAADVKTVRKAMRGRPLADIIASHPAVVVTPDASVGASLVLSERRVRVPKVVLEHIETLRKTWELPGRMFADAMLVVDAERQLSQGFYYRWKTKPSIPWLNARAAWSRALLRYLPRAPEGRDQPALVQDACVAGRAPTQYLREAWEMWREHKNTKEPETEAVWLSTFLVDAAQKWLAANDGLVWTAHTAMHEKLEGTPRKAQPAGRSAVVSMKAHGTGFDLQKWHLNLVLCPGRDPSLLEQVIGRTHRQKQEADSVEVVFTTHTNLLKDDLEAARVDAQKITKDMKQPQRLDYGDWR